MSEQLAIDFTAPLVRARRRDPETSKEAAAAFAPKSAQRSVETVVQLLREAGRPLSDFEIAARWASYWGAAYSESLPRKARHWAREANRVKHDGYGEHQGRKVRLWSIS